MSPATLDKACHSLIREGLTPIQYLTLSFLAKGPTNMRSISKRFNVTPAAMTGTIDRLVSQGFASRRADNGDRRLVIVSLTSEGSEILGKILEA